MNWVGCGSVRRRLVGHVLEQIGHGLSVVSAADGFREHDGYIDRLQIPKHRQSINNAFSYFYLFIAQSGGTLTHNSARMQPMRNCLSSRLLILIITRKSKVQKHTRFVTYHIDSRAI